MSTVKDATSEFFLRGNTRQFDFVLKLYPQVLALKAEEKKKPEELIKLDEWYQTELPKKIKQRGRDAHLIHEELVQCMKWKQSRGKYYPQLSYLIKVNTPRAVVMETKKAFRKLPNIEQAITALSNLKGVGTTMASALLAAALPENAPFMADEVLKAIPDIEGIDYTTREYLKFVTHIESTRDRLNQETESDQWSAHSVELAVWTHSVACDIKPELLKDMPDLDKHASVGTNGANNTHTCIENTKIISEQYMENNLSSTIEQIEAAEDKGKPQGSANGAVDSLDESTLSEDSLEPNTPIIANDETNDSDSHSSAKRSLDSEEFPVTEPELKKAKNSE
ncbi:CLUMA_CG020851, isoform A [Clunio marinus]|uniref:CLUMA_CG020851, isoform A n=1 Tax=Clunio marinus TaxID=568069 RepID=A0A1J1J6X4_9DIPT|nr:CLUMA_CG020851, isoform A [Clunio marinus]